MESWDRTCGWKQHVVSRWCRKERKKGKSPILKTKRWKRTSIAVQVSLESRYVWETDRDLEDEEKRWKENAWRRRMSRRRKKEKIRRESGWEKKREERERAGENSQRSVGGPRSGMSSLNSSPSLLRQYIHVYTCGAAACESRASRGGLVNESTWPLLKRTAVLLV